jgi:hypothetical protein
MITNDNLLNHPRQELRFFVSGNIDANSRSLLNELVAQLSTKRAWVLGPPTLVEGVEHPEGLGGEDSSNFIQVGIEIYSALPPWGNAISRDIDATHFQEVSDLITAAADFSAKASLELDFFLDDVFVGQIQKGQPDKLLTEGLLGEWQRALGTRPQ